MKSQREKELKEWHRVIQLNREPVDVAHIEVSGVRPCKGIRYDPKEDRFVEVSGFGFYVTELGRTLYSLVYDSNKVAEAKREEFIDQIANAGAGACLFI